jgi:circadian clock protein KaiC
VSYLKLERAKSGIQGLDELIESGFPKGFCYAIVGGPGAGKTIFGCQFLYSGINESNENGIYVTLEEPPHSIANNMTQFGWNLYEQENKGKLSLIDYSPTGNSKNENKIKSGLYLEEFSVDGLLGAIAEAKRKINAKRCVIDSIRALSLQYRDEFETRQQILKLVRSLTEMGLTTILLDEISEEKADSQRFGILDFLAQGVIYLHTYRMRDELIRAIEVRKMRGTKITNKLCPYIIKETGILVFPQETVFRS